MTVSVASTPFIGGGLSLPFLTLACLDTANPGWQEATGVSDEFKLKAFPM